MLNLILTLVFSVVMLVFMAFPAMKIVEWIEARKPLSPLWHNTLQIIITMLLSLSVGLFLRFG